MKRSLFRTLLAVLGTAGLTIAAIPSALAALPTSGQCGILTVIPHSFDPDGVFDKTYHLDELAVVDFSTNTISYNLTEVTIGQTPVNNRHFSVHGKVAFTTSAGVFSADYPGNSYTLTFTPAVFNDANGTAVTLAPISYNLLLVNSGHTILVQGQGGVFHGVCQMF